MLCREWAVALAWKWHLRLAERGKDTLALASALIGFAVRAAEGEGETAERAARQRRYLTVVSDHVDPAVLASEEMWR